jgi:hypothetical protein
VTFAQPRVRATHDFYAAIHKGLRYGLSKILLRLGSADLDDAEHLAVLMADLRQQMHISEHHLANEDLWVHTALEARAPGAATSLAADHAHHREAFEELEGLVLQLEAADALDRPKALRRLYLRFSTFVADDFAHMAEEEQLILPVLQSLFTDEELIAIETGIRAALPPEDLAVMGALMVPAQTPQDRLVLVQEIRQVAPPEAFGPLLAATAEATLSAHDYTRLIEGLGMAA